MTPRAPVEALEPYFRLMHQVISNYGLVKVLYTDRHTIFLSPKEDELTIQEQLAGKKVKLTQFGRAMDELDISMISAGSPQAKGRIERLWDTLQSRLPVELEAAGIKDHRASQCLSPRGIPARLQPAFCHYAPLATGRIHPVR